MMKKVWFWCLHCERAFPVDLPEHAKKDGFGNWEGTPERCPYPGCDGHIGDIWSWESIREDKPEFPEIPVEGNSYPLNPGFRSDFKPTDYKLGDNEFWCVGLNDAAKLMGCSMTKLRMQVLGGAIVKIPYFGKELIPLPEIATYLEQTPEETLEKAVELELRLTMLGMF